MSTEPFLLDYLLSFIISNMRKEVTSLLMLLTSVAMTAQESNWTLTPKAGMTVSTLAGEDAEYCSNAIGWTAGVDLGRRLSERVELTANPAKANHRSWVFYDGKLTSVNYNLGGVRLWVRR